LIGRVCARVFRGRKVFTRAERTSVYPQHVMKGRSDRERQSDGEPVPEESLMPWRVSRRQTIIWATSEGVRCVVAPYDETRYQLRLLRAAGTVKADLFASVADANRAARRWREEVSTQSSSDWPQQWSSDDRREHSGDVARSAQPCARDRSDRNPPRPRGVSAVASAPTRRRPR
jgi:hypothetical protein